MDFRKNVTKLVCEYVPISQFIQDEIDKLAIVVDDHAQKYQIAKLSKLARSNKLSLETLLSHFAIDSDRLNTQSLEEFFCLMLNEGDEADWLQEQLNTMKPLQTPKYKVGDRRILAVGQIDDDDDKERYTPKGNVIEVFSVNPDNGAWGLYGIGCPSTGGNWYFSEEDMDRLTKPLLTFTVVIAYDNTLYVEHAEAGDAHQAKVAVLVKHNILDCPWQATVLEGHCRIL